MHTIIPDLEFKPVEIPINQFLKADFKPFESLEATTPSENIGPKKNIDANKNIDPNKNIDSEGCIDPDDSKSFRWIHVPVNNLDWVEVSVAGHPYNGTNDKSGVF